MTFLNWLAKRYLDEALGERYCCPSCGADAFAILPELPGYKDRWKCHRCPNEPGEGYGDAYDLLRLLNPDESQRRVIALWKEHRKEWEKECQNGAVTFSSRGLRGNGTARRHRGHVDTAWGNLHWDMSQNEMDEAQAFLAISMFMKACDSNDVSPESMLKYWREFLRVIYNQQIECADRCTVPACDCLPCQAVRGERDDPFAQVWEHLGWPSWVETMTPIEQITR